MSRVFTIDPAGDLTIILHRERHVNPDDNKESPAVSQLEPESPSEPSDPEDVPAKARCTVTETVYYRVSKRAIRQASLLWRHLLDCRNTEEQQDDCGFYFCHLHFSHDNPEALAIVLLALHKRNYPITRVEMKELFDQSNPEDTHHKEIPPDTWAGIASVIRKYHVRSIMWNIENWIAEGAVNIPGMSFSDATAWVRLTWVLRLPNYFKTSTRQCIRTASTQLHFVIEPPYNIPLRIICE